MKALEAINYFKDGNKYRVNIFQKFKVNGRAAEIAVNDCKELDKPFSLYFFKIWSQLNK